VSSGGQLSCQKIYHLYAGGGARADVTAWRDVIGRCFTEADRSGIKTLAMPPVGTGNYCLSEVFASASARHLLWRRGCLCVCHIDVLCPDD